MKKGERVTGADVAPLRTEKVLSVGLSPEWEGTVVGAILARDVEDGSGVSWDDLIPRLGPR
jgi:sialic acid synthase SpsE